MLNGTDVTDMAMTMPMNEFRELELDGQDVQRARGASPPGSAGWQQQRQPQAPTRELEARERVGRRRGDQQAHERGADRDHQAVEQPQRRSVSNRTWIERLEGGARRDDRELAVEQPVSRAAARRRSPAGSGRSRRALRRSGSRGSRGACGANRSGRRGAPEDSLAFFATGTGTTTGALIRRPPSGCRPADVEDGEDQQQDRKTMKAKAAASP